MQTYYFTDVEIQSINFFALQESCDIRKIIKREIKKKYQFGHFKNEMIIIFINKYSLWKEEFVYFNEKQHNDKGPAYSFYGKDGSVLVEEYWLNDKLYFYSEWLAHINGLELFV